MTESTKNISEALNRVQGRHISSHAKPYYSWIRHVVALSLAALTALISLQASYLPSNPQSPMLLVICWAGLLSAALLGTLALAEEFRLPLAIADTIQRERKTFGELATYEKLQNGRYYRPSLWHRCSAHLMTLSFVLALCSLFAFATVNLLFAAPAQALAQ